MLKAVVYDAYGTLYDVHSVMQRCESLFPGKGPQLSQLWRTKQLEYTWQRSLMNRYVPFSTVTREALAYSCKALGIDAAEEAMQTLMREYLALACFPDVRPALEKLSGKRQAILSNGSPDMLAPLVAHSALQFDAVLSVDSVKVYKPSPAVYQLVLTAFGVEAGEVAFVSSNCWDALGARAFGFASYWINRNAAPVDRLGVEPVAVLRSLGELPARLST
jgi:2-haloacid dehalogenase